MKRQLMIEVDCGGRRCKRCPQGNGLSYCDVFGTLETDERGRPLRRDECHDAEQAAGIGVVTSMSFGKDAPIPFTINDPPVERIQRATLPKDKSFTIDIAGIPVYVRARFVDGDMIEWTAEEL